MSDDSVQSDEPNDHDAIVVDTEPDDDVSITPEARTFVILATTASVAAFDLGFDLGAFDNVDHRKQWAIWILSFVALTANFLIRDSDYRLAGFWQAALALPTVWLVIDAFTDTDDSWVAVAGLVTALIALPFGLYVLARLMFGDYFRLSMRLRVALGAIAVLMVAAGWFAGYQNERFMTCEDFARAGEFVPDNCRR